MDKNELFEIGKCLKSEYDLEFTEEELLNIETLSIPSRDVKFIDLLNKLPSLKVLEVDPDINISGVLEQKNEYRVFLNSGKTISWIENSMGGRFLFSIEYGGDDCIRWDLRENFWYLFDKFETMLDFIDTPKPFIDDNFNWGDGYIFKKIEDDIIDKCGFCDDYFVNIIGVRDKDDNKIIWSKINDINFDDLDDANITVGLFCPFIFSKIEDLGLFDDAGNYDKKAYELAGQMVVDFVSHITDKVKGNIDTKILFGEIESEIFYKFPEEINKADVDFESFMAYITIKKNIPSSILNNIFLDMNEYAFSAAFSDEDGKTLTQYYDYGRYELGHFYNGGEDDYIDIESFDKVKEKLMNV